MNLKGKVVMILARDHSSSINIDREDLERIRKGTATIIVIGFVIDEDEEKIMLGSFFTFFQGERRHYEVHSILRGDVEDVQVLKEIS
jgi:hypothetical protein